jgi:endoglucanase
MMGRFRRIAAAALLALLPLTQADAACNNRLRGINLVPLPTGWYNGAVEMKFPDASHITYYREVGMNAIRLPLYWEEMQPILNGSLNARYLQHTREFLDNAHAQGMKVLIDLHNYARYRNVLIGSNDVPVSSFAGFWKQLAAALKSHPAVFAWGLMNEPHHTNGTWPALAQAGVNAIRTEDGSRPIYVSGDNWSNSQTWPSYHPAPFVSDPANRIVYEAHIYFDDNFSGKYVTPIGSTDVATRTTQRLKPFLDWLQIHGQHGAIGETGVPMDDPRWLQALSRFLDMTDVACTDWFMWAGGAWRPTYELNLEPIDGQDRPQIELIRSRM